MTFEKFKEYMDKYNAEKNVCPNCGYCPHCGKAKQPQFIAPYYPYWNPWYEYIVTSAQPTTTTTVTTGYYDSTGNLS